MKTKIIQINSQRPDLKKIELAAKVIQKGGLVVFPTETVYGLGANVFNQPAVKKIFQVKKRPLDNPVIVHLASIKDLEKVAQKISFQSLKLAKKFWPGPLTLIFKKKKNIPSEVSGGLETVAVRVPKHKVALALIKKAKVPLAAPSANLAGRPSPTKVEHVIEDLEGKVEMILKAGPTKIGLESTVLDLSDKKPVILRPGGTSREKIEKEIGPVSIYQVTKKIKRVKSPGLKYRHYAPKAKLILIIGSLSKIVKKIQTMVRRYKKAGILASQETKKFYPSKLVLVVGARKNLRTVAKNLFATLRKFDEKGVKVIIAESFPQKEIGLAIMNRLKKAATKIIKV